MRDIPNKYIMLNITFKATAMIIFISKVLVKVNNILLVAHLDQMNFSLILLYHGIEYTFVYVKQHNHHASHLQIYETFSIICHNDSTISSLNRNNS